MTTSTLQRTRILNQRITSSIRKHAVPATATVDADLRKLAPNVADLNSAATLTAVADCLDARFATYEKAQATLDRDLTETRQERDGRDQASIALRTALLDFIAALRLLHGADTLKRLKLSGRLPPGSHDLLTFATSYLGASPDGPDLPAQEDDSPISIDFDAMHANIADLTRAFRASLWAVSDEERDDQRARVIRDKALAAWTRDARFARNLSRATLERVGRSALADRILPTNRQLNGNAPITPLSDEDSRFGA